jgi:hypothetical protein
LIHIFQTRANNRQWTKIQRSILMNEQGIHVIILSQEDVRTNSQGNVTWLVNPIKQACANARACTNTRVVLVDLIPTKGELNLSTKRKLRRAIEDNADVAQRVDAARIMTPEELDRRGLTRRGERLLVEIITQTLQEMPVSQFV